MKKVLFIILFLIIGWVNGFAKVYIAPSYNELLIKKDKTKKYVVYYELGNTKDGKDAKITVQFKKKNYYYKNKKAEKKISKNDIPVSEWLKIDGESKVKLKKGEKKRLTLYITPPKQDYSELSANIVITIDDGSMIKSGLTVPLYVIVKDNAKAKGNLKTLKFKKMKKDDEYIIRKMLMSFNNDSNIHLRPQARLVIKDSQKKIVYENDFGDLAPMFQTGNIRYSNDLDIRLKPGRYTADLFFKYYFKKKESKKSVKLILN